MEMPVGMSDRPDYSWRLSLNIKSIIASYKQQAKKTCMIKQWVKRLFSLTNQQNRVRILPTIHEQKTKHIDQAVNTTHFNQSCKYEPSAPKSGL